MIILIKATAEASLRWVAKLFMVCFPTVDAALMTALVYCLNSWLKHYNAPFLPPTVQVAWIQFTWIRGCLFYETSFDFVDFCRWSMCIAVDVFVMPLQQWDAELVTPTK